MRKFEKLAFFWNGRNKFSRLELYGVYTGNRYPCWVSLLGKLKKREPHIGYTEIILYWIKESITPNAEMIQLSNISCGETHHS